MKISKRVRDAIERWLGTYYEGPEPPERMTVQVTVFANVFPHATRAEWVAFAQRAIYEAYCSGYVRGAEYVERAPETWLPEVDPTEIADATMPGWRDEPVVLHAEVVDDEAVMEPRRFEAEMKKLMETIPDDPVLRDARRGR